MTILVSIFGVAGRLAGDLLTTALGWASSLLFGRVPRSHQVFLVLMMALSILWMLARPRARAPRASNRSSSPRRPIRRSSTSLARLCAPPGRDLRLPLRRWPGRLSRARRGRARGGLAVPREILRGYLLAPVISGLLVFLAVVGIARKIRSKRHGWEDDHVPIVVKPDGYDQARRRPEGRPRQRRACPSGRGGTVGPHDARPGPLGASPVATSGSSGPIG